MGNTKQVSSENPAKHPQNQGNHLRRAANPLSPEKKFEKSPAREIRGCRKRTHTIRHHTRRETGTAPPKPKPPQPFEQHHSKRYTKGRGNKEADHTEMACIRTRPALTTLLVRWGRTDRGVACGSRRKTLACTARTKRVAFRDNNKSNGAER